MNSRELAEYIGDKLGQPAYMVEKVVHELPKAIKREAAKGGSVRLGSLGVFVAKRRAGRTYSHPKTGELFTKPAQLEVGLRLSKKWKKIG